jgi:hypothetical protein
MVSSALTVPGEITQGAVADIVPTEIAGARRAVVTEQLTAVGEQVGSGSILGLVSGRPLTLMSSSVPLYRELRLGDSGPDVRALQDELIKWGYPLRRSETVGNDMLDSLRDVYSLAGAAPPGGVGKEIFIDPNEFIQVPGDGGTVVALSAVGSVVSEESPFVRIQTSPNSVTARVGSGSIKEFAQGTSVSINAAGSVFQSEIASVGPFVESDGKKMAGYDVTATIPSASGAISVGSSVTVSTPGQSKSGSAVPLTGVRQDSSGSYVLVEKSDKDLDHRVDIKIAADSGGWAVIEPNPDIEAGVPIVVAP